MREIDSVTDLREALNSGRPLTGVRFRDVDLTGFDRELLARGDYVGVVVLGGRIPEVVAEHLRLHGALIFPTDTDAPVNPYRATLYQPEELYAGLRESGYATTPDALAYAWARDAALRHDGFITLLRAIHDESMSEALGDILGARPVVGVMGGHALARDSEGYAAAAHLGHQLASAGLVVSTGGGPGAMEAANLGAFCTTESEVTGALDRLRGIPGFKLSIDDWARVALDVHDDLARERDVRSIGIPTWFYGHEPPNVFCDGIAKYFANAVREDGLLSRSTAGIVVLAGAAGTVQEIFQAMTPRFYAADDTRIAPLVLVGENHWRETIPVWPAIEAMSRRRNLEAAVQLVDSVDEAATLLVSRHLGEAR